MKKVALKETREEIKKGVDILANVVKTTLGGKGKNVIINNGFELPKIINDGVTIAREVEIEDDLQNTGATLAKQTAEKTNDEAGDGTTTTIVLLQAFLEESMNIDTKDVRGFREKVQKIVKDVIKFLDENKRDLEEGDIFRIAKNSSLDDDIAKTVEKLMLKIGKDGIISIEDGEIAGVSSEIVSGVQINDGYMSPFMITDPETMKATIKNAPILLSKKPINNMNELVDVMENLQSTGKTELVVMVEEIDNNVLAPLVVNKMKGVFSTVVVKTRNLEEIAVVTGAEIITQEAGTKITHEALGYADKVECTKYRTIVVGGKEDQSVIDEKIEELKKLRENADNGADKQIIAERIAKLKGGVSLIKIAGENDVQTKEIKLKLEDALNAVKSAMDEGIIEGGGMALLNASFFIQGYDDFKSDEASAFVCNVIEKPFNQILKNADEDLEEVLEGMKDDKGYNVVTRKWEDFYKSGVIDPVKVVKRSLVNAFAMGTSIITAEASIVVTKEENNK